MRAMQFVRNNIIGRFNHLLGTVTSLKFTPENGHLISCSQDGSIAIFRVGSWQPEKVWTAAHKGAGEYTQSSVLLVFCFCSPMSNIF